MYVLSINVLIVFRFGLFWGVVLIIALIVGCIKRKQIAARNRAAAAEAVAVSNAQTGTTGKQEDE